MEHRTRTVGRVGKCRVEHCSCGTVHVSVGNTTVRITAEAARDLHSSLATLVAELGPATASTTVAAPSAPGTVTGTRPDASVHDSGREPSPSANSTEASDSGSGPISIKRKTLH